MKSFLTKVGALLMTVVFAFAGCQDYDEDIRKVNEQLNTNTAELTTITEELEAAIEALEAKVANDYATKAALEELKAALQAKDTQLSDAIAAIDAAYKAADAALKSGYETADANLQKKIDDASKAATEAIETLTGMFERTVNQLSTRLSEAEQYTTMVYEALNAEIEKLKAADTKLEGDLKTVANNLAAAKTELEAADAAINTRIDGAIANIEKNAQAIEALTALHKKDVELLQGAIAENSTSISALQIQLRDLVAEYEQTVEDLQGAIGENTALIESVRLQLIDHINTYNTTIEQLENQVTTNEANITMLQVALNALTDLHATDVELLQAAIAENTTAIEAEVLARINAINELKELHTTDVNNLEEVINDNERKIGELQFAVREMQAVDEDLQNQITELDKKLQTLRKEVETYYALKTDVTTTKEQLNKLEADVYAIKEDVYKNINELKAKVSDNANKIIEIVATISGIQVDVEAIASRVQSLVYVPDYSDGKATLGYAMVAAPVEPVAVDGQTAQVVYLPAKSTLRYKVNSTSETAVADLVAAYKANKDVFAYDLEGVKVATRAGEGDAELEIVNVYEDKDGYLAVEVMARNFKDEFYTRPSKCYSAALVLVQEDEKNNVASEFTNLIAEDAEDAEFLSLVVEVVVGENTIKTDSDYTQARQFIASTDLEESAVTAASTPYIKVDGDETLYTVETLYAEYGIEVELEAETEVGSVQDEEAVEDYTVNFNVVVAEETGSARTVTLNPIEGETPDYTQRVGEVLTIVDAYTFYGNYVAVEASVEITKAIVYINFEAQKVEWTLKKAIELRGDDDDNTPYAKTIVLKEVPYSNIYDLSPITGNSEIVSVTLNGEETNAPIKLRNIKAPESGVAGKADIYLQKGYEFAAADAEKDNTYVKVWKSDLNETTIAIVTVTVTLAKYPECVDVNVENVDLPLVPGTNNFDNEYPLIADAYAALAALNADGFVEGDEANTIMFEALTDEANTVDNDPESAYNLNFVVAENVDNSWVRLYGAQYNYNIPETVTFKRDIETWFGVPFHFTVNATPKFPVVELTRSTEYASDASTETEKVYDVKLQARIVDGVYTVKQSDLAFYLNTIGAGVHATQKVSFEVVSGIAQISNKITDVEPLETPINNPLIGADVTGYLAKANSILTWNDPATKVVVKATLWADAYTLDVAYLNLYVEDPLTFTAGNVKVDRKIEEDTVVPVYKEFCLTSTVEEHASYENLLNVEAETLADIFTFETPIEPDVKTAYGIDITTEKITVYEEVTLADGSKGQVLYDTDKYTWVPETGIITLKKDDAAELLNPIVAEIRVNFTHKVHGESTACKESKTIEVRFVQPE